MQVHLSECESVDEVRDKVATEGSVVEPSTKYAEEDEEASQGTAGASA